MSDPTSSKGGGVQGTGPNAGDAGWYDLFSRGARDWLRHNEKVREAVRQHLPQIVAGADVLSGGASTVRVPVRMLEHYRFKLRLPNALPHIFTALKLASTASIVGAIIGELPSGIQTGLGIAILNFARYYNQSPPRLWASILVAGLAGILFFFLIVLIERLVVRWRPVESK